MSYKVVSLVAEQKQTSNEYYEYPLDVNKDVSVKILSAENKNNIGFFKSYEDKEQNLVYWFYSGQFYNYVCVTDINYPRRIIKPMFCDMELKLNELDCINENIIKKLLKEKYNYLLNPNDKIISLNREIDDVKNTMIENIDKVLVRGDNIDTLRYKTDKLAEQADNFHNNSKELKCEMLKKNLKLIIGITFGLLFLILIIILISKNENNI